MPGSAERTQQFNAMFEQHYDAVMRYCLRRTDTEDARDAASQAFVVAWRKLDQAPEQRYVLPWLYRIAQLELSTSLRSQRRRRSLRSKLNGLASPNTLDPETMVVRAAEHVSIMSALNELSSGDREIILLRSYEELSFRDIGVAVGCSEATARKRLSRALRRLRRQPIARAIAQADSRAVRKGGDE